MHSLFCVFYHLWHHMLSLNHQLVRPKKNLKYTQVKRTYSYNLIMKKDCASQHLQRRHIPNRCRRHIQLQSYFRSWERWHRCCAPPIPTGRYKYVYVNICGDVQLERQLNASVKLRRTQLQPARIGSEWLWPPATLRHKALEPAASPAVLPPPQTFLFELFYEFYWLLLATRFEFFKTTLAGCPGFWSCFCRFFGLIVSHFLWPVFRLQVPSGHMNPHSGHNLTADCTFMAKSCSCGEQSTFFAITTANC